MATDPLKALIEPDTGSLSGSWGTAALNVNFSAIGGMLGGSQTISLSSGTTFTLSAPAGSITAGAGPNQAQNFMLQFSGTLSGNAAITLPLPGFYVVFNNCTVGTNYIQFRAVGTGLLTGIPQGRQVKVWCDGANAGLCDQPEVGSFLDVALATTPAWFAGCFNNALATAVLPYLICDGSTYSFTQYPALAPVLGSTFGGNGINTFGVPDLRARYRIPLDNQGSQGAAGRVTTAISSINGTTLGAAGGSQSLQQHTHTWTPQTQNWTANLSTFVISDNGQSATGPGPVPGNRTGAPVTPVTPNGTIGTTGAGSSQNIPPGLVAGLALIKT